MLRAEYNVRMLLLLILAIVTAMALPIAILASAEPVVRATRATVDVRPAVRGPRSAVRQWARPPTA